MQIGALRTDSAVSLAPMAGCADDAFRILCRSYGAAATTTELVSAKGVVLGDVRSREYFAHDKREKPLGIQLFGGDPETMALAARVAETYEPDFIDINMGCPAPKVSMSGGGARLLQDIDLAARITEAVVKAVSLPVTVKMRIGWDAEHPVDVALAKKCEAAGAAAVTLHARTREQMYAPSADWSRIRAVKQAVKIPVIGNGDIRTPADAMRMLEETGCDHIMIGRAALGAPWLFLQVNAMLEETRTIPDPDIPERMRVLHRQAELTLERVEERTAMLRLRKHAAWYLRGFPGAAEWRGKCGSLETMEDLERLCYEVCCHA